VQRREENDCAPTQATGLPMIPAVLERDRAWSVCPCGPSHSCLARAPAVWRQSLSPALAGIMGGRRAWMVDDFGVVDALQVDGGDAEVGVPKLG
jgi:hypothetical protein